MAKKKFFFQFFEIWLKNLYNKKKSTLIWSAQLEIMNLTQRKFLKIEQIIHFSIVNIYLTKFFPAKSWNTCQVFLCMLSVKKFLDNSKMSSCGWCAVCKRMTQRQQADNQIRTFEMDIINSTMTVFDSSEISLRGDFFVLFPPRNISESSGRQRNVVRVNESVFARQPQQSLSKI